MPSIAILDDQEGDRRTIQLVISTTLKKLKEKTWSVVSGSPPPNEQDVLKWLDEHDATVLVSDWKLNEGAGDQRPVNYEADKLIKAIRLKRPSFPIYVITGFESEAKVYLKDVERIFTRAEFAKNHDTIVPQMIRAGLRRYDEQRDMLGRMDELAKKMAHGDATKKDRSELQKMQGYFQAELPTMIYLDDVLKEFENVQKETEALKKKVQRRIDQGKGRK